MRNMENQGNITSPKITNPTVMASSESELDEIPENSKE